MNYLSDRQIDQSGIFHLRVNTVLELTSSVTYWHKVLKHVLNLQLKVSASVNETEMFQACSLYAQFALDALLPAVVLYSN